MAQSMYGAGMGPGMGMMRGMYGCGTGPGMGMGYYGGFGANAYDQCRAQMARRFWIERRRAEMARRFWPEMYRAEMARRFGEFPGYGYYGGTGMGMGYYDSGFCGYDGTDLGDPGVEFDGMGAGINRLGADAHVGPLGAGIGRSETGVHLGPFGAGVTY